MTAVGMRKRAWFKAAGVVAFAAQLLGGAGLASAQSKTCMPQPTFVSGGDPVLTASPSTTPRVDWRLGLRVERRQRRRIAYEIALANNLTPTPAQPRSTRSGCCSRS